jgi:hypothetical protein
VLHFAEPKIDPPLGYFDGPLGGYLISDEGRLAVRDSKAPEAGMLFVPIVDLSAMIRTLMSD